MLMRELAPVPPFWGKRAPSDRVAGEGKKFNTHVRVAGAAECFLCTVGATKTNNGDGAAINSNEATDDGLNS